MPAVCNLSKMKKVYFAGIGGISMSALAMLLKGRGVEVCGYDGKPSDTTERLINEGIPVYYSCDEVNYDGFDTLVYTAALKEDNPLIVKAKQEGLCVLTRAELLGAITGDFKHSVGVAGTHGKSTTTGFLAEIMLCADNDSTILAGAVIPRINSTYKSGSGDVAVFEACEYKNSYHSMRPTIKVVLNAELDHVDFFGNLENVILSFRQYIDTPGNNGENISVINLDSENAVEAAKYTGSLIKYYSVKQKADVYAENIDLSDGFGKFDIMENGEKMLTVKLAVPGIHNVSNALAAFCAARCCEIPIESIAKGLESFGGVKRRFERKGTTAKGAWIVDDYAHHPDEITVTLNSAKKITKGKVICIFQPHTYSRTAAFVKEFALALSIADKVLLAPIYAARETNTFGISSEDIAKLIDGGETLQSFEELKERAESLADNGDIVITMGSGDVYKVFE